MFLGLRTAIYYVADTASASAWYSEVLGVKPYFNEPYYVGFNVGGFELGLHPREEGGPGGMGGVVAYWGVSEAKATFDRLLELGAEKHEAPKDVGEGVIVATVLDPFGNVFGVIENPHFSLGA